MIDRSFLKELGLDPVVTIDASFIQKPLIFLGMNPLAPATIEP